VNTKKLMAENRTEKIKALKVQNRIHKVLAKRKLTHFATLMNDEVEIEWFHKIVYDVLDEWIAGTKKKVAIFMPPQHGKSTMSSVTTPAKILGEMPKSKVAVCSFSDTLAKKFNRQCQDIIDSRQFRELYPGVILPAKGIETTNELRNTGYFETVKHKGFFKAVSIGGSLTGDPVDFGIIDDPIKDRKQANSKTYRDGVWNWYQDVFLKRLHNDSRQLMLFTRWHEDDLAGRLFNPKNEHFDLEESKEWTILCFQALKEAKSPIKGAMEYDDPRKIGEALWESKHSKHKHEKTKRTNPTSFSSLDQQRPSPAGGNIIKKEWFNVIRESELPFNPDRVPKHFMIDGAFTENSKNDESAQISYSIYKKNLYIFNCQGVRKELNEYLKFIVPWFKQNGYKSTSEIAIEMKASGYGFYSMLKSEQYGSMNCLKINSKHVAFGKMTRAQNSQPTLASGKVFLIAGGWNESFVDQCANYPNDTHDDMLDLLCYAIHKHFISDDDVFVYYS
jgi:predicted phage terminase large subunit-like protein